jgi:general secretion pathway protein G
VIFFVSEKRFQKFPANFQWRGVSFLVRLPPDIEFPFFFMKLSNPSSQSRRNAGFTLLEMVIVLGIIAMILGGAIFTMKNIGEGAKMSQVEADFKALEASLAMYKINAGTFPTTQQGLKALVEKPTTSPVPRRWVKGPDKVPLDPWKNEYGYRFPGRKKATEVEIISKGPDGTESTPDDLSNQDE